MASVETTDPPTGCCFDPPQLGDEVPASEWAAQKNRQGLPKINVKREDFVER